MSSLRIVGLCDSIFPKPTSIKFKRYTNASGTLANGAIYIGWSLITTPDPPILGLFAGCDFNVGDVVTSYGGARIHISRVRCKLGSDNTRTGEHSHMRYIPGSDCCLDGRS